MLKVGLTGGIASGKTTVLQQLAKLGAQVFNADEVAHRLISPGEAVYVAVVKHFGVGILDADGTISRQRLAELAFAGRIEELNRLVHPAVLAEQARWLDEQGRSYPNAICVVEAPLLLEAGGDKGLDKLIVVACRDERVRVGRFARRAGVTLEAASTEVSRRMAKQMPEAEKIARADYVIDNSGSMDELTLRVVSVWAELKRLA